MAHRRLAHIDIATEVETAHGWSYKLTLAYDDAGESHHTLDLDWVDYEYWSGGDKPPSLVAERLLEAAFAINPTLELPHAIDASTLRRQITDLDQAVLTRL